MKTTSRQVIDVSPYIAVQLASLDPTRYSWDNDTGTLWEVVSETEEPANDNEAL